jgi:hypothetical protein
MLRSLRRLLVVAVLVGTTLLAVQPAAAIDVEAPAPTEPKPSLWAEIDKECFGSTPGVRWTIGNNTNGPHLFGVYHNGDLVHEVKVDPGEVKTSAFNSPHWEDTHQQFQIVWQSQGTVLAQLKPWLDCIQPELTATVGTTDPDGNACAGTVALSVTNTGTQNANVQFIKDHSVMKTLVVATGATTTVEFEAAPGAGIAAAYLNHGLHELFFGTVTVDCAADDQDQPSPPDGDGTGNDGGASLDDDPADTGASLESVDEPGTDLGEGEPEPVVTDLATTPDPDTDLASEIAMLTARHGPTPDVESGSSWTRVALLGASAVGMAATGILLLRP